MKLMLVLFPEHITCLCYESFLDDSSCRWGVKEELPVLFCINWRLVSKVCRGGLRGLAALAMQGRETWNVVIEPEVGGGRRGRKGLETEESVTWC